VHDVFAVQAQDAAAAFLAVRARTEGASAEAVERALASGAVVRAWAMRGTLHLLAAEDLPLVLAVFGPIHLARGARRLQQLGLPPPEAERSTAEAAAILAAEGPLTRHELAARLRERGVPVAAEGQAAIHVVRRAALAGVLVEVGVSGRYGPLDLGPLPDRAGALASLGRRYVAAHAPASCDDFAAWSGLPAADVRVGWNGEPRIEGEPEAGGVRLLGAFEEWLLGWASRDLVVPRADARRVAPGGGIIRPVAIADGRAFATWRLDRPRGRVELDPFGRVTRAMRAGVDAEVAAIGAFLGRQLSTLSAIRRQTRHSAP
jgi:winged helix DNA-binding protein